MAKSKLKGGNIKGIVSVRGKFFPEEPARSAKVERNGPCPCGSGKKQKRCCGSPKLGFFGRIWHGLLGR